MVSAKIFRGDLLDRMEPRTVPQKIPALQTGNYSADILRHILRDRAERDNGRCNSGFAPRSKGNPTAASRPVLNGNFGGVQSEAREWMGRQHSILIHLPPLATVAFKLEHRFIHRATLPRNDLADWGLLKRRRTNAPGGFMSPLSGFNKVKLLGNPLYHYYSQPSLRCPKSSPRVENKFDRRKR